MKNMMLVGVMVLLSALAASAQDASRMETFLGYSYMRANSATNVPAFSLNGGSAQFVYNFNHWIGGVIDVGAVHNGGIGAAKLIDNTIVNYLFGPRVTYHNNSRFTPFVQILWGGVRASSSNRVDVISGTIINPVVSPQPISTVPIGQAVSFRSVAAQTSFGMTVGGGIDLKLNKNVSVRPIGLDYFLTRLQNYRTANDNNQHNLRYTAGVNFTFGAQ